MATVMRTVVLVDIWVVFTTGFIQPASGLLLVQQTGYSFWESWLIITYVLYAAVTVMWIVVGLLQIKIRDTARAASSWDGLPETYHANMRLWGWLVVPSFALALNIRAGILGDWEDSSMSVQAKAPVQSICNGVSRRRLLRGAASLAATALAMPAVHVRANQRLKVGTAGGFFEESFVNHIYPDFTKETGIEIESVAQPTGQTWLLQLRNAAKAGVAPADVSMMTGVPRMRGALERLWAPLDERMLPNTKLLNKAFIARYDDGQLYGVGALSWYVTLCSNTVEIAEPPTSWADMWDSKYQDTIGLLALPEDSYLLEITATTFFDGVAILQSQDGIAEVLDKFSEIGPNVRLWYEDQGTFQLALQEGEVPLGQFYHNLAVVAAEEGFPLRSTFPMEGGVADAGFWLLSKASEKQEEAQIFLNYATSPAVQAKLSRTIGTAPVVARQETDLTEKEFNAVSSDIPPIVPQYDIYLKWGDWISDRWMEMIAG